MAITLIKQPQQLQPVYNEMIIVVSSTFSSEENFNFLATIKVDGVIIANISFPVNPDGYGVLDLHRHLQGLVTDDFNPPTQQGFIDARNSYVKYEVEIRETFRPKWFYQFSLNYQTPPPGGPYPNTLDLIGAVGLDPTEYFNVGDLITIVQEPPYLVPQNNGITTIAGFSYDVVNNYWVVTTNKPFIAPSSQTQGGYVTTVNFNNVVLTTFVGVTGLDAFNGVRSFVEFNDWDSQEYDANQISPLGVGQWLTNMPEPYHIQTNSNIWLNAYSSVNDLIGYLKVQKGPAEYYLINPLETAGENLFKVNVSPESLNAADLKDAAGNEPPVPIDLSDGDCYFVSIVDDPLTGNTIAPRQICIKDNCSRYEDIQLVFMDKLGSFIPFHFYLVHRHNKSIARETYQKDYGKYAPASNNWKYNNWDRGTKTLDTRVTDVYIINSDWVNQTTSDFLMTLIESPEVYWFKENGDVVGINLTVSSIERKQTINDQLVNYTLTFELSNKDKQQIG